MPRYRLHHSHQPSECRIAYAAWRGFASPLRHKPTVASCALGGHEIWWDVEADDEARALALLPGYVGDRTQAVPVDEVQIP